MKVYLKYICFLLFGTGTLLAQNISFKDYISRFKLAALPLVISREKVEENKRSNANFMEDSVVSKFIGPKLYPVEEIHYVFKYYACPVKNDSITAAIYMKMATVQGEDYLIEMALYNSKTKKLLDRMCISTYHLDLEKEMQFIEDGVKDFSEDSLINFSPSEIGKDLTVTTISGVFKMTLKGFDILSGAKVAATDW